jgi:hypothetical protein
LGDVEATGAVEYNDLVVDPQSLVSIGDISHDLIVGGLLQLLGLGNGEACAGTAINTSLQELRISNLVIGPQCQAPEHC